MTLNWCFEGLLTPGSGYRGGYVALSVIWMIVTTMILELHDNKQGLRCDACDFVTDVVTGD